MNRNVIFDRLNLPKDLRDGMSRFQHIIIDKGDFKGANGYCFFGINSFTNSRVAVKIYYYGKKRDLIAEPQNLARLSTPNIIKILDAGPISDEWGYFITPFCKHGDLDDLISKRQLGQHEAIDLACGVLSGLAYLHGQGFVHRDIKPANIFVTDEHIPVIGDFGSVKRITDSSVFVSGSGHSILYRPAESIKEDSYSMIGDIYQVGVLLFQLCGGSLPYTEEDHMTIKQKETWQKLRDPFDRSRFVDSIICEKIVRGKLLELDTLPLWLDKKVRAVIKKATNTFPEKRFQSPSHFLNELSSLKKNVDNWKIVDGHPTLVDDTSFRVVCENENCCKIEKKRYGDWRQVSSSGVNHLAIQLERVSKRKLD